MMVISKDMNIGYRYNKYFYLFIYGLLNRVYNASLYLTVCLRASAINRIPLALASATASKALASP